MDSNEIINYVMNTPGNTNRAVLSSMLDQHGGGNTPISYGKTYSYTDYDDVVIFGPLSVYHISNDMPTEDEIIGSQIFYRSGIRFHSVNVINNWDYANEDILGIMDPASGDPLVVIVYDVPTTYQGLTIDKPGIWFITAIDEYGYPNGTMGFALPSSNDLTILLKWNSDGHYWYSNKYGVHEIINAYKANKSIHLYYQYGDQLVHVPFSNLVFQSEDMIAFSLNLNSESTIEDPINTYFLTGIYNESRMNNEDTYHTFWILDDSLLQF